MERRKAAIRPSSPRSSRISSTSARYSRSSSRTWIPGGSTSGRSSTSTRRRPRASVVAAPAAPRCRPLRSTACAPPGNLTCSTTSAIVPTAAYAPSWRGTRRTRSSPPTSIGSVTFMFGKTTRSSSGTRSMVLTKGSASLTSRSNYKDCSYLPGGRVCCLDGRESGEKRGIHHAGERRDARDDQALLCKGPEDVGEDARQRRRAVRGGRARAPRGVLRAQALVREEGRPLGREAAEGSVRSARRAERSGGAARRQDLRRRRRS